VTDPSRIDPFKNHLILKAETGSPSGGGGPGGRRKGGNTGQGDMGGGSLLALPQVTTVTEERWNEYDFNERSALKIVATGLSSEAEVYDYFVNIDNKYLRIAQKEPKSDSQLLEKQFTYGLVLIGMAILQDHQHARKRTDGDGRDGDGSSIEEIVASTTRAVAPILLPLIEAIGGLSADDL
jgi:hypothetical protein